MSATIAVAGLGRCGSSLTMQLLDAAGFPTVGSFPGYEDDAELEKLAWHPSFAGKAFKMIDPHRWTKLPSSVDLLIWLSREEDEQAASQLKFALTMMHGRLTTGSRHDRTRMAALLRKDRKAANAALETINCGARVQLTFERLLHDPVDELQRVSDAIGRSVAWDTRGVRDRLPTCYPGLLELELIAGAAA